MSCVVNPNFKLQVLYFSRIFIDFIVILRFTSQEKKNLKMMFLQFYAVFVKACPQTNLKTHFWFMVFAQLKEHFLYYKAYIYFFT